MANVDTLDEAMEMQPGLLMDYEDAEPRKVFDVEFVVE